MSSKKAKRQREQDERDIKTFYDILSGRVKLAYYEPPKSGAQSNRIGGGSTIDGQKDMALRYMRLLQVLLPGILAILSQMEDPRSEGKIKHSLPALMLYGILMFLCHTPSRRAANRDIGGSELGSLMEEFVPDYSSMPHADTLARLLEGMDVDDLEKHYRSVLEEFVRSDEFRKLNPGRFLVAVDGVQAFSRDYCWDERALSRNAGDPEKEKYYVYMLESVLILESGMVLPLLTETLENGERLDDNGKQDCETKAFKRLAERIAELLGDGVVTVLLDGLYASGPIVSLCRNHGWEFMISLKKDCLKSVWEDFNGLRKIEPENVHEIAYGDRLQDYAWSNGIEYTYGNNHKRLSLNVVTLRETWHEKSLRKGKPCLQVTEYAWLSSSTVTSKNVFDLCKAARTRWRIENHFHMVKNQGYSFKHCFSYDWNAMKGYCYLMKFAVMINTLILSSLLMQDCVIAEGKTGVIKKVWDFLRYRFISDFGKASDPPQTQTPRRRCRIRFRALQLYAS